MLRWQQTNADAYALMSYIRRRPMSKLNHKRAHIEDTRSDSSCDTLSLVYARCAYGLWGLISISVIASTIRACCKCVLSWYLADSNAYPFSHVVQIDTTRTHCLVCSTSVHYGSVFDACMQWLTVVLVTLQTLWYNSANVSQSMHSLVLFVQTPLAINSSAGQ